MKLLCKTLVLTFLVYISVSAQTSNEITLSDSGNRPSLAVDGKGNVHAVWEQYGYDSTYLTQNTYYSVHSSDGKIVVPAERISAHGAAESPKVIIGQKDILIIWGCHFMVGPRVGFKKFIDGHFVDFNGNKLIGQFEADDHVWSDILRGFPSAIALNDTTYRVVWESDGPGISWDNSALYSQVIPWHEKIENFELEEQWQNFTIINQYTTKVQHNRPIILRAKELNQYAVVWLDNSSGKDEIYSRIFNLDGSALSNIIQVTDDPESSELFYYRAAMDSSGQFTVVWSENKNGTWQIKRRSFNFDGTPESPSEKITTDENKVNIYACVDISIDKSGSSVISWEELINSKSYIYMQRFQPDGKPLGESFNCSPRPDTVNNIYPETVLSNNKIYLAWVQSPKDLMSSNVMLKIMDFDNPLSVLPNEETKAYPESFSLYQNYPNPFNPTTTISYSIPEKSYVELKVFDMLGKEVETLVNGYKSIGTHTIQFNGSSLPSGIYIYSIHAGDYRSSRKLMLIK